MNTFHNHVILVVDDEKEIRLLLRILLEKEGYSVLEAGNGREAIELAQNEVHEISLILLDIMMPDIDGFMTAKAIRAFADTPILFLTARSSDADKMQAYGNGGDDYIVKPFHATDLKLKIHAVLKRYDLYRMRDPMREEPVSDRTCVSFPGEVEWYPDEKAVYRKGEQVVLTDREYELFARLCTGRGESLSPAVLYEEVWGEPYLASSSNTVIVHIANLRRKLEKEPSSPTLIRTVWGKGYRID